MGLRQLYRKLKKKHHFFWSVNWIKTYYFNYKMFPSEIARKLPVFFYGRVALTNISGTIQIDAPIKRAMIGIGQPYENMTRSQGVAEFHLKGTFVFKGHVQFGRDCFIHIGEGAYCELGHLASLASRGKLICKEKIVLGDYARIGSESQLMDTNFHQMINTETGEKYPMTGAIEIGDHNFISTRVTILQGTKTPSYCTIASNSLCTKDYTDLGNNVLIGGIPAKLLKNIISRDWEGEHERMVKNLIVE